MTSMGLRSEAVDGSDPLSFSWVARTQFGERQSEADGRIGRHDARSARIGDDRHTPAARQRLSAVQRRGIEQLGDRVHSLHAALHQQGIIDRVGPGQRTRVAADGLGPFGRSSRTSGTASACASARKSRAPSR